MRRFVSLSLLEMGTCCSATNCGRLGGGSDCVVPNGGPSAMMIAKLVLKSDAVQQ